MCKLPLSVDKCLGCESSDTVKMLKIDGVKNIIPSKSACLIRVNADRVCCKSPLKAEKSVDRGREDSVTSSVSRGFYYYASFTTGYWKSDNSRTREHVGSRRDFYRCSNQIDRFEITSVKVHESFNGLGSGLDHNSVYAYRKERLKYVFRRVESKKISLINKNTGDWDNSAEINYSSKSVSYCSSSHEREETNEEELQRRLDRATGDETFRHARLNCSLEKRSALRSALHESGAENRAAYSQLREERQKVRQIEHLEYSRNAGGTRVRYAEETLRVSKSSRSLGIWSINGSAATQKCVSRLFRHGADGAPVKCRPSADGAFAFLRNAHYDEDAALLLLYACESVCEVIDVTFTEVTWRRPIRSEHEA